MIHVEKGAGGAGTATAGSTWRLPFLRHDIPPFWVIQIIVLSAERTSSVLDDPCSSALC